MKILISNDGPFAHYYIRMSLGRVLSLMGHQVIMWDIHKKPVFDAFDEFEPDLFIGQTFNVTKGLIKCLSERPHCKAIMKASDWGLISDHLDRKKYPVLIANDKEIELIKELQEKTGKPDFVYVHYTQESMNETHAHWQDKLGIKIKSLLSAADVIQYSGGEFRPEYECDFCFVGGRWGYKAQVLDRWLIPLLTRNNNYRVKIFGNQPWNVPQYCGFLPDDEVKHLFASTKVCINLSEPHSQDLGYDIIERPYKLLAAKACVLSDYVQDLIKLFPTEIEYADTPEQFKEKLDVLLQAPKIRKEMGESGYASVMKAHTYFHRVHDIMLELNMPDEASNCMTKFEEVKEQLKL